MRRKKKATRKVGRPRKLLTKRLTKKMSNGNRKTNGYLTHKDFEVIRKVLNNHGEILARLTKGKEESLTI